MAEQEQVRVRPALRLVRSGGGPVTTTRSRVDDDTVRCLRSLLQRAEAGELIGVCYAGMLSDRDVFYSSCGEAYRDVGKAATLVSMLMHGTMRRMFGEDA